MSKDPSEDFRSLYHPENPAAILPQGDQRGAHVPSVAGSQFAWGMIGNGASIAMAIFAPLLGLMFLVLTMLGVGFAVMGTVYGGSMISTARANDDKSALRLGHVCRITGLVALAMHLLSGIAWILTIGLGVQPLLW